MPIISYTGGSSASSKTTKTSSKTSSPKKSSTSSSSTKKPTSSSSSSSAKKPAPKKEKSPPRYPKQLPGREGLVPHFDCVYKWKYLHYEHDQVFPYGTACGKCLKHSTYSPMYYTKHGGGPPAGGNY